MMQIIYTQEADPRQEICSCGALKAEHAEGLQGTIGDALIMDEHGGPCARTGCKLYTFARFVSEAS